MELDKMTIGDLKLINQMFRKNKSEKEINGGIRIVILQRGWVYVGRYSQIGMHCTLKNAFCIRKWGTSNGLPELAIKGKLNDTILDPSPTVHFHKLTEIASIECDETKWNSVCK